MTSTNMGMTIPVPLSTVSPDWGTQLQTDLGLIDLHDHSVGKGARITPAGINISTDISFNNYNIKDIGSTRYKNQLAVLAGTYDKTSTYV